eukprot:7389532-Prymnesium_polylepis.1
MFSARCISYSESSLADDIVLQATRSVRGRRRAARDAREMQAGRKKRRPGGTARRGLASEDARSREARSSGRTERRGRGDAEATPDHVLALPRQCLACLGTA